jgi:RNA polymerase sigma-70 factor (ECF subfamily)
MQTLPNSSPSNEDLAARAQHGCMPSFEELLRRFQVPLLHFLRNVGPEYDAEDVLQETFLRAYSRLNCYRPQWQFSTWLFTIARRISINYHRRPQPVADHESLRQAVSPQAGPEQIAVAAESRQYLWTVAARILGKEELTALWLHYVEGMPVAEIADVLDRSSVAVKTMMFRARKKLLPLVSDLEPEGRSAQPARPAAAFHGSSRTNRTPQPFK